MFETTFGYVLVKTPSMQTGHYDGLKSKLEALDVAYGKIEKQARGIRKSGDLTAKGKKRRLADLAVEAADLIQATSKSENFETLKSHAADIANSIRSETSKTDNSVRDLMRAQEVREHYKSLNDIERQAFFEETLRENVTETIEALRDSPFPLPGMGHSQNQKLLQEYCQNDLARLDPDKAAEHDSLLEAYGETQSAVNTMVNTIRREFGIEVPGYDEIKEIAEGDTSEAA